MKLQPITMEGTGSHTTCQKNSIRIRKDGIVFPFAFLEAHSLTDKDQVRILYDLRHDTLALEFPNRSRFERDYSMGLTFLEDSARKRKLPTKVHVIILQADLNDLKDGKIAKANSRLRDLGINLSPNVGLHTARIPVIGKPHFAIRFNDHSDWLSTPQFDE